MFKSSGNSLFNHDVNMDWEMSTFIDEPANLIAG